MKKDRFNELVGIFKRLTVENQLRLIEFMGSDISLYDVEPRYKNQLKAAYRLLNCIEQKLHSQEKDAELAEMISIVETLSINQLMELLDKVSELVYRFDEENKQEATEKLCEAEGHVFSKWKKHKYNRYVSPVEAHGIDGLWGSDRPHDPTIPIPTTDWRRTCDRCGHTEIVEVEPEEVKEERLAKFQQARVRRLQKELENLQSDKR